MNKQPSSTIMTRLCWGAFFLVLVFLAFQVIPRALGQRNANKQNAGASGKVAQGLSVPKARPGVPAALATGRAAPRKSGVVTQAPYDVRGLPAQAPKFPYSSVRDRGTESHPDGTAKRVSRQAPAGLLLPTPWQLVANMALDHYGAAGASDGTYSYHAGGYSFSSGNTLDVFYRFDPVANAWATMAPMPQSAIMASAVYYPTTNKIYVFGGEDAVSGVNYSITRMDDIATNTWSTGANMPDVRSFMASGYNSANGKIYLVSGYNTGQVTSAQPDTWEYDPVANTFTSKLDFPHPAGGMASGVINGHLYVAGEWDADNLIINLLWDYDIAANTWTARANMPGTQTNVPGSGVALGRLWAFGGGNPFGSIETGSTTAAFARPLVPALVKGKQEKISAPLTFNGTFLYDPVTDSWSSPSSMNSIR